MIVTTALLALQLTGSPLAPAPARPGAIRPDARTGITDPILRSVIQQVRARFGAGPRFGVLDQRFTDSALDASGGGICDITAAIAARAAQREAQEDLLISIANCLNESDPLGIADCLDDLWDGYAEALSEARHVFAARNEVCMLLGGAGYDPQIDPSHFMHPDDYADDGGNAYYPLVRGSVKIYEKLEGKELERITITVEDDTRRLLGVECAVVRDTVEVFDLDEGSEGEIVEDTFDYLAVDKDGNVWYFGEDTWELENGVIVNTNGRWLAGEDFAKPGILMHADPVVNTTYRQEYSLDEAEDMATLLALDETVKGPLGPFMNCRKTADFTPLDPGALEFKYYAEGLGLVREEKPDEPGAALVLIDFYTRK